MNNKVPVNFQSPVLVQDHEILRSFFQSFRVQQATSNFSDFSSSKQVVLIPVSADSLTVNLCGMLVLANALRHNWNSWMFLIVRRWPQEAAWMYRKCCSTSVLTWRSWWTSIRYSESQRDDAKILIKKKTKSNFWHEGDARGKAMQLVIMLKQS